MKQALANYYLALCGTLWGIGVLTVMAPLFGTEVSGSLAGWLLLGMPTYSLLDPVVKVTGVSIRGCTR